MTRSPRPLTFPKNFVWGFAAAAPQIEGAAFEDGKGMSVWDDFARQPGRVHNGDNLDVACDHYHRFDDDFRLMRSLGVTNYRLSIAWPRILPDGGSTTNQAGIDFYHRLFDSMERHGITPWVTMFHWDTPMALEKVGGWRNRATVDAFARYADTIVRAYGRRVKNWITLNEIPCFTSLAYSGDLDKAPGIAESPKVINQTLHHAVLAHGHGVRAVREHGRRGSRVGLTDVPSGYIPVEETETDIAATRQAFTRANDRILGVVTQGRYSASYLRACGKDRPVVKRGDLALISLPTDFLGLNIYYADFVRAVPGNPGFEVLPFPKGYPQTTLKGWLKTTPQAMYWTPRFAREIYGANAIYITENGYGAQEEPEAKGELHDLHRRDYLRQYLKELRRGITDGIPVRGYFAWSFLDNFEWADGYSVRFGLCHTDYKTQKRTPKLSARWYSRVVAANAVV
jgi:beta-glucosidase